MVALALSPSIVTLQAQVNNFADVGLLKTGGEGILGRSGTTFTLDFGTLVAGAPGRQASLAVINTATGLADFLRGSFAGGVASPFSLTGFVGFDNLAAGASFGGLQVLFTGSVAGDFESSIVLRSTGFNAGGFAGALADQTVVFRGSVAAVPEPGTYAMLFSGLMMVLLIVRRRTVRPVT